MTLFPRSTSFDDKKQIPVPAVKCAEFEAEINVITPGTNGNNFKWKEFCVVLLN